MMILMTTMETTTRFDSDIPLDLATSAHRWTSHVPETRGEQERADYVRTLTADFADLQALATDDAKQVTLEAEFAIYRLGYQARFLARLSAMSRCASTMVTGASGFNARRAQKRSDTADKRGQELRDYRERALAAISRALQPELAPIRRGDADERERLLAKLADREAFQALATKANKAIKGLNTPAERMAALESLGIDKIAAASRAVGNCFGQLGFAPFEIKNNGAEIRRIKARIASLEGSK
jgi:hypothetical protein